MLVTRGLLSASAIKTLQVSEEGCETGSGIQGGYLDHLGCLPKSKRGASYS
jgi:hypothetical protein